LMTPVEVEDVAREMVSWCGCLSAARYFFRYDWADGTFRTTDTDLPDADLAWVRDTMVAYAKAMPPGDRTVVTYGSPNGQFGPLKQLGVILTNDSFVMLLGERSGHP